MCNMKIKLFNFFVAIIMVCCILSGSGVFVADASSADPAISSDDAYWIAAIFVADVINTVSDTKWSSDTTIADIVTMYDETDAVSAYTVKLTVDSEDNGYVVVSAYDDTSLVLEYSDQANPIFDAMNLTATDKVIYTGALQYYKEDKNGNVTTVEKKNANKKALKNELKALKKDKEQKENAKILKKLQKKNSTTDGYSGAGTDGFGTITNPITYANATYGGTFSANSVRRNDFESYVPFYTTNMFDLISYQGSNGQTIIANFTNQCGPTTITNFLHLYRNAYTYPNINTNKLTVFLDVAQNSSINNGYFSLTGNGTTKTSYPNYIKNAFSYYGYNVTTQLRTFSFAVVRTEIDGQRPFILSLSSDDKSQPYSNHAVLVYAYNQLANSSTGYLKSFIKVADTWSTSGRYIDVSSIPNANMATISR